MAEVNGLLVIPVKQPTIPHKTTKLALEADKCSHPETTEPILAPALREGAKIPPADPLVKEITGPKSLKTGRYHSTCLFSVNSTFCMISFPEPKLCACINTPIKAIIRPAARLYRILPVELVSKFFFLKINRIIFPIALPA